MFSCYRDHTNQVHGDTETERLDRLNMHGYRVRLAVRTTSKQNTIVSIIHRDQFLITEKKCYISIERVERLTAEGDGLIISIHEESR